MSASSSPYTTAAVTCGCCGEERERLVADVYRVGSRARLYCGRCRRDTEHSVDEVGL